MSISYPEHELHRQEHVKLIEALSRIPEELAAAKERELDVVHKRMTEFLHRWLIDHVVRLDLRMKPFAGQFKAAKTWPGWGG